MVGSKHTNNFDTSQICLKDVMTALQFCGGCPLYNVRNSDPSTLKFKWLSWKTCYAIVLIIVFIAFSIISAYKSVTVGTLMNQLISPVFNINTVLVLIILIKIARQWMPFMVSLCKVEELISKKYEKCYNVRRKINIITSIIFGVAFVEHTLSNLNYIFSSSCHNNYAGLEYYIRKQFHYIFHYFHYNVIGGVILWILSWVSTFIWNFGDTMIITMSIIISSRFKQMSMALRKHVEKGQTLDVPEYGKVIKLYNINALIQLQSSSQFWKDVREDYNKLDSITKQLDRLFSDLVTLSYSCNLTFILAQLFNSLRNMDSLIERLYFFYSFAFVILRTVAVSIYGASIYEECQAFLPILNAVPTESFNQEIHRLVLQIYIDPVALSGHNFFKITRGLVLNVAAAIITYELVLIQFNQATLEKFSQNKATNDTICV